MSVSQQHADTEKHTPYYAEAAASPDFPKLEQEILAFWQQEDVFNASVKNREGAPEYVFYDGPPFANGLPHYGHLLTGYVKDIDARYRTMRGHHVPRRFGWDCHGLPAEMGAEKELKISGRKQIEDFGIEKFNAHCRESVMQYASQWETYVNRQARWVDFKNDYKTMDKDFMESVLWAFKQLFDKGLIYQSVRVMPYSWAAQTPLSNFETRLDNSYRERADKAATVLFTLTGAMQGIETNGKPVKLAAWTTTPWTLPSNLALAVGAKMEYALIERENDIVVLGAFAVNKYAKDLGIDPENLSYKTLPGSAFAGLSYAPLLPYFTDTENAFRVLEAGFVEEGEGTGIVHIAPGFGEDDQALGEAHGIPVVCPVDAGGCFTAPVDDYLGIQVFDANDEIIKKLKLEHKWLKTEQYLHNYPHCWRTDTPLIYKAVPSWYVEVTKFKDRMVELNQQINWIPGHIKDGQFGKWLENARDWSISRNRFWGTPIPVWQSDNPENDTLYVFGSITELEEFFGEKVEDLHRPFIDNLTKPDPQNPQYTIRRTEDVFDCWFESGSMPFAQVHYPFTTKEFEPADFIVEYVAQTRGWFYTLMVLSTALFDRPPFKNCVCHGVVLDANGQKLSKRLQNYADPQDIFAQYGSDALRWLMVSSPVIQGGDLLIDKEGNMVRDAVRLALKPIWNAYHFFTLYANADGVRAQRIAQAESTQDRYILACCRKSVDNVRAKMDAYDFSGACKEIEAFFEILNNWYIRRAKERFWRHEKDDDKQAAYDTLYTVLDAVIRAGAPLMPLLSEAVYRGLRGKGSVHLQDFPDVAGLPQDEDLLKAIARVRDVCNTALSIRNKTKLRIRQPLAEMRIADPNPALLQPFADILKDELNVKRVTFTDDVEAAGERVLKILFPVLGKRLPAKMKDIIAANKKGEAQIGADGSVTLAGETLLPEEFTLLLDPKDAEASAALSTQDAVVTLDIEVTPELEQEGVMRDIIRLVQQSRKDAGLDITDRILLTVASDGAAVREAASSFSARIAEQTLAREVKAVEKTDAPAMAYRFTHNTEHGAVTVCFDTV